ncbi:MULTISPECIES: SRPBCC family protein [unclassified Streptomyces]|uniref:SRPBCC family protein n=1 Tax=unclassified Streptomyces TaxID=2593676 RepID=UPI001BE831F9|nr:MULTISPECIES: SRPBCC family protein [unclassified Streptomyces]MBT2405260.1 SRPBCC family protein [Streptomyces sp. ISL-21]MBT2611028.1 SRPBCC family protein [Streptomyces sp. ISL-87]
MATTQRGARNAPSGFDRLLDEAAAYLSMQADQLADKAVDKVGDVTDRLYDVAENGGQLPGLGGRLLKGDSPVKAVLGQTLDGLKDTVKDAGAGLLGGKGKGRKGGGKAINIVEAIDVGVPLRTAYDHWTQYEDFSSFAKGVRSVSQSDDTTTDWKVKVGPSTRSWKATVEEQIPDERIVWSSGGPKGTTRGCVSFHELAPSLTRILLVVEYYPAGLFEKTGNLWRAQGRRMRLDLKNFNRFVSLSNEEPEGWRGEIQDGEVVLTHEEALEDEEEAEEAGSADEPDEPDEEYEEPESDDEEEQEEDYPDEEEEEEDEEEQDEDAYEDEDEEPRRPRRRR